MRDIKFRAWDRKNQVMIPFTRDDICEEYSCICWSPPEDHEWSGICGLPGSYENIEDGKPIVAMYELMQYTGLKDKNGKEIYEGDILSFDGNMTADNSMGIEPNGYIYDENSKHAVVWDDGQACWSLNFEEDEEWKYKRDTHALMLDSEAIEVIGNIYENPKLLEGTKCET